VDDIVQFFFLLNWLFLRLLLEASAETEQAIARLASQVLALVGTGTRGPGQFQEELERFALGRDGIINGFVGFGLLQLLKLEEELFAEIRELFLGIYLEEAVHLR
jgi:hypothetical protein